MYVLTQMLCDGSGCKVENHSSLLTSAPLAIQKT
eukprot:SAG11_NODE_19411_length_467_cov_0.839674_1_plen_33_part_10